MRPAWGAWVTVSILPSSDQHCPDAPHEGAHGLQQFIKLNFPRLPRCAPRGAHGLQLPHRVLIAQVKRCAPRGAHGLQPYLIKHTSLNGDAPREGHMGYSRLTDGCIIISMDAPREGAWVTVASMQISKNLSGGCVPRGAHGLQWVHRDRGIKQIMMRPARGRMGYSINIALF